MTDENIKSIAQMAWQSAANAFRMYPNNKHTFAEHWYTSKETYLSSLPAPTQDGTAEEEWKLIGHSYQIADTGDYDGCYEITDGKISIRTNYDDDEALQPIVNALNSSGCSFWQDDAAEFENRLFRDEIKELRAEIAGLVQTIESHREQRELDRICYENKLTEANQRVKELEEKVQAKEVLLIGYRDLTEGMI